MKEELRAEVIANYREELMAEFEQKWTVDKKAAVRKETEDEYDAMLSQMRKGKT